MRKRDRLVAWTASSTTATAPTTTPMLTSKTNTDDAALQQSTSVLSYSYYAMDFNEVLLLALVLALWVLSVVFFLRKYEKIVTIERAELGSSSLSQPATPLKKKLQQKQPHQQKSNYALHKSPTSQVIIGTNNASTSVKSFSNTPTVTTATATPSHIIVRETSKNKKPIIVCHTFRPNPMCDRPNTLETSKSSDLKLIRQNAVNSSITSNNKNNNNNAKSGSNQLPSVNNLSMSKRTATVTNVDTTSYNDLLFRIEDDTNAAAAKSNIYFRCISPSKNGQLATAAVGAVPVGDGETRRQQNVNVVDEVRSKRKKFKFAKHNTNVSEECSKQRHANTLEVSKPRFMRSEPALKDLAAMTSFGQADTDSTHTMQREHHGVDDDDDNCDDTRRSANKMYASDEHGIGRDRIRVGGRSGNGGLSDSSLLMSQDNECGDERRLLFPNSNISDIIRDSLLDLHNKSKRNLSTSNRNATSHI